MGRYRKMFDRLEAAGEGAFIPFAMLGDPNPEVSLDAISVLVENGADALELGLPFSDPIADGSTVQRAGIRSLEAGTTVDDCFELIKTVRQRHPAVPIGILTYANLVCAPGKQTFYGKAAAAGVDSVLVADVPTLESEKFVREARLAGVDPVLIATPNGSDEVLETVAAQSTGYTYVVSRPGPTGAERAPGRRFDETIAKLRRFGSPPCVVGFGISKPEHVQSTLQTEARGVVSGSAVIERIESGLDSNRQLNGPVGTFVSRMKKATR